MSDRVEPLSEDEIQDPELQGLIEGAEQMLGDSRFARLMARQPGIMKRFFDLYGYMYENASVEGYLKELMRVKSAQVSGCHYWNNVRIAAVRSDVEDKEDAVLDGDYEQLTEREATAVELARRFAEDPRLVDDAFFDQLSAQFSDDEIVELMFSCWIFNGGNKFNIALDLDPACLIENAPEKQTAPAGE